MQSVNYKQAGAEAICSTIGIRARQEGEGCFLGIWTTEIRKARVSKSCVVGVVMLLME